MELDDVDWQLLELLQAEGRMTFSELGRRVSLSAPATTERVRRLEERGIITGYGATIDATKLGLPIEAIVREGTQLGRDPLPRDDPAASRGGGRRSCDR